jgi:NADH:ubiquinone oxidoreductase subunit E
VSLAFSEETRAKHERLLTRYPDREAAILPTLYLAQREFGHLSDEAILYVADLLGFTPARIYGVATFYTMYNKKPVGKYHLQVCRKIGVKPGETTADGRFTLSTVECLGSCGTAPVMQVNDDYYENLTEESIDAILDGLG